MFTKNIMLKDRGLNAKMEKKQKQTNKQKKQNKTKQNKTKKKVISLRAPTHMCDLREGM